MVAAIPSSTGWDELVHTPGVTEVALVDFDSGEILITAGSDPNLDFTVTQHTELVRRSLAAIMAFDRTDSLKDLLYTQSDTYHLARLVDETPQRRRMLYIALERNHGDLAHLCHRMKTIVLEQLTKRQR